VDLLERRKGKNVEVIPDFEVGINPKALSKQLSLATKTLAMMRCSGTGPAYRKIRGKIFYSPSSVQKWLEKHPLQTTTAQDRSI